MPVYQNTSGQITSQNKASNPREPKLSFSNTFCTSLAIVSEKLPKVSTALRAKCKSNKIKQKERREVKDAVSDEKRIKHFFCHKIPKEDTHKCRRNYENEMKWKWKVTNGRSKHKNYIRSYKGGRIFRNNCFKLRRTTKFPVNDNFLSKKYLRTICTIIINRENLAERKKITKKHAIWLAAYFFVCVCVCINNGNVFCTHYNTTAVGGHPDDHRLFC